jgi:membrane-associated phospholipid phosphatase
VNVQCLMKSYLKELTARKGLDIMLPTTITGSTPVTSVTSQPSNRFLVISTGIRLKLVGTVAFVLTVLTLLVLSDRLLELDTVSEQMLSSMNLGMLKYPLEIAVWFGKPVGLLGSLTLASILLLWQKRYKFLWFLTQSSIVGFFLTATLKPLFHRIRPGVEPAQELYCYPSGHTLGAVFVYASLVLIVGYCVKHHFSKLCCQILLIFLIFAVGFGRVYYNTHYPSDVIASFLIGMLYFLVVPQCYKLYYKF